MLIINFFFLKFYPNSFVDELIKPYKYNIILNGPLPTREEMERHAWNPQDRSLNIFVKEQDKFTIHRHPVPQSTDCIRGKVYYLFIYFFVNLKF